MIFAPERAMESQEWISRTTLLLGEDDWNRLHRAHVLVVGLGGVGAIAAEMIARSGVGRMTIVDGDTVEASNRNRQIPALKSTEGQLKTELMAARLKDINPDLELTVISEYLKGDAIGEILETPFDFVLDCIDTLAPKVFLIRDTLAKGYPIVSSMGAGGRLDPSQVCIADISESYNCHLAKYVRKRLHKMGIRSGLKCVYSPEPINQERVMVLPEINRKKSIIGTISYIPAVFGCCMASVAIRGVLSAKA